MSLDIVAQLDQLLREALQRRRAHDGLLLAQALPALDRLFRQVILPLECGEPRPVELIPQSYPIVVLTLVVFRELCDPVSKATSQQ